MRFLTLPQNFCLAALFAAFVLASPSVSAALEIAIAKCDRLAASPLDPTRPQNVPGVPFNQVDGSAAVKACTEALAKNPSNARIEFELARALERTGAPPERIAAFYREASDRGSLLAAHNLANALSDGKGVPKDEAEATRLFRKAAEGGISLSMTTLAQRLANGIGIAKNETSALSWFRKGSEAGDMTAMAVLSSIYADGHFGVASDNVEAFRWHEKAAAAGWLHSRDILGGLDVLNGMSTSQIIALKRRLADEKCYVGELDGSRNEQLKAALLACPDQRPQLKIETGMHVATIGSVDVDPTCRLAVTGSNDKTARLWSLTDGALLRTFRAPIGDRDQGVVSAVAISPNGRFVASGGIDARFSFSGTHSVTVFDAENGTVVARIGTFNSPIKHLAFSPDGRWLAVMTDGVGMIEASTWRLVASEMYDDGWGYDSTFGPDGRLYTIATDGKIRRYSPGPKFGLESFVSTNGGKQPVSISVDQQGLRLAIGYSDSRIIDLYDTMTLTLKGNADTRGIDNGIIPKVAWGADGGHLLAGGTSYLGKKEATVVLFDRKGLRLGAPTPTLARNTIEEIKACGEGYAIASADSAFGLLDNSGQSQLWRKGVNVDMSGKLGKKFMISSDAKNLLLDSSLGDESQIVFDLMGANLLQSIGNLKQFHEAMITGLPISDWQNKPRFGGAPLFVDNNTSYSLAIRPDRSGFVLGTQHAIRAFDAKGIGRWQKHVSDIASGVNFSADGRIIVAALNDGTVRWYRWSDGQELLALFANRESKAWVAWTPTGYYSASPGGEDMIGWHVNRGWDQAADFFPASRFHDQFARPDIVERVLDTLDEAEAVKQANAARGGKAPDTASIVDHLPPVVTILSPADGAMVNGDVSVDYLIRSPSGLPVDSVEALIDGRPVSKGRGLGRMEETDSLTQCLTQTRGLGRVENALQGCWGTLSVSLPPGTSEIGIYARSGERSGEVVRIRLTRSTAPSVAEAQKPKLYALVIGISAYLNRDYALGYPAKDAHDFAAALINQKGGLYSDVEVQSLTDEKATATAIKDGFDWLQHRVTGRDTGVIYLAGHGMVDERDRFYFIAADSDATRLRATGVSREDISDALDALSGKALLFLDACHAGAVAKTPRGKIDINTVVNDFSRGEHGVVVFAASTGRQESQENAAWNNGAFTKAVVEGIGLPGEKPKADFLGNGRITTSELDAYITDRVKSLTSGDQTPVMIRPPTVPDFSLASAR